MNLPNPVADDLEIWRFQRGRDPTGLIFPRSKNDAPWRVHDYRNWGKYFKTAAKKAGLKNLTPYDLRHTCASLLAAAGWNHLEIAKQLGHSPETSVRVYQHLLDVEQGSRLSIDGWIVEARNQLAADQSNERVPE